ncbi:MAG: nodulation protein NfeD [Actinomycetota bacterium]
MRRFRTLITALAAAAGLLATPGAGPPPAMASGPVVRGVDLATEVTPVSARWIHRALDDARDAGARLFVIRMDTPGGLDSSMRAIVRDISSSPLTVAVWVAPDGARAASAGAYIAAASDVVAMAPGSNIGSATPVAGGSGGDLDRKIVNDAAAYIAALAGDHGRDAATYRRMVTHQLNLTARDAVRRDVAEVIARTPGELLARLDGMPGKGGVPLRLDGATLRIDGMPWHLRVLDVIADPNLVFLFFSLGILALGWEVFHPGAVVPGVVGAILLILALFGLSILPFDWAGIAFMLLAAALFAAEVHVAGVGFLAAGGVASLVLGGLILFDEPGLESSSPAVIGTAAGVGIAVVALVRTAARVRHIAPASGDAALVGMVGRVRSEVGAAPGQVFVNGELWRARTGDGRTLGPGERVRVVKMDELTLTVEPTEEE